MASFVENINKLAGVANDLPQLVEDLPEVLANLDEISTVSNNIEDVQIVANSISNVNNVGLNINSVITVANDLNEPISEIEVVANNIRILDIIGADLNGSCISEIQDNGSIDEPVTEGECTGSILQTVAENIDSVVTVAENISTIIAVDANETNINTVSTNSSNINTVSTNILDVGIVADNISDIQLASTNIADIQAVADEVAKVVVVANDLNEAVSEIDTVANNIDSVNTVGLNIDTINTVSTNIDSVNTVANISTDVSVVSGINEAVSAVSLISDDISTVAGISTNVTTVAGIASDVTFLATNWGNKQDHSDYLDVINQNLDTNADVTFDTLTVDSIQFTGGTGTQGTMSWNADEETMDLIQDGATLQLGQELQVHCRNATGVAIPNATVVMAVGTLGASGRIKIAPYNGTTNIKYILGVTTESIGNGEDGKVTTFGKVRDVDTALIAGTFTDGVIYASTTVAGGMTYNKPTSNAVPLAFLIANETSGPANNGTIMVRVTPVDETILDKANTAYSWGNHAGLYVPLSGDFSLDLGSL